MPGPKLPLASLAWMKEHHPTWEIAPASPRVYRNLDGSVTSWPSFEGLKPASNFRQPQGQKIRPRDVWEVEDAANKRAWRANKERDFRRGEKDWSSKDEWMSRPTRMAVRNAAIAESLDSDESNDPEFFATAKADDKEEMDMLNAYWPTDEVDRLPDFDMTDWAQETCARMEADKDEVLTPKAHKAHDEHRYDGVRTGSVAHLPPGSAKVRMPWRTKATADEIKAAEARDAIVAPIVESPSHEDGFIIASHEDDAEQGWLPTQIKARKLVPAL